MTKAKAATKTTTTKPAAVKADVKPVAKPAKVELTPEQVETAAIAKAEAALVEKYGSKIVVGSARRATDARFGRKIMVKINTIGIDGKPDGKDREIASSDVFQVHHTIEVATELRKAKAADKRAAAKAAREAAAPKAATTAAAALGIDD